MTRYSQRLPCSQPPGVAFSSSLLARRKYRKTFIVLVFNYYGSYRKVFVDLTSITAIFIRLAGSTVDLEAKVTPLVPGLILTCFFFRYQCIHVFLTSLLSWRFPPILSISNNGSVRSPSTTINPRQARRQGKMVWITYERHGSSVLTPHLGAFRYFFPSTLWYKLSCDSVVRPTAVHWATIRATTARKGDTFPRVKARWGLHNVALHRHELGAILGSGGDEVWYFLY